MKKILFVILLHIFYICSFAQEWGYIYKEDAFENYDWNIKYTIRKGAEVYNFGKDEVKRIIEEDSYLKYDWLIYPVYRDKKYTQKRYKDYCFFYEDKLEFYSSNDVLVEGSDTLPQDIIFSPGSFGFIPICYNEVIQSDNPKKKIEELIPNYTGLNGVKEIDGYEYWWEERRFLDAFEVRFSNVIFSIDLPTGGTAPFLVTKIIKKNNFYVLKLYPDKGYDYWMNFIFKGTPFENFPVPLDNNGQITLILEITPSTLKLYNQNNEFICELMKVSNEWLQEFPDFLVTEKLTENLKPIDLTQQTAKATSSANVAKNKLMTVKENLKLRSGEATSTQVLAVMQAGTKVKILELGKAESIDGINSNWVKVEVQKGAKDREGKPIKSGTVGWCYGGYLE